MLQVLLQTCFSREFPAAVMTNHLELLVDGLDMLLEGLRFVKRLPAHVADAGFVMAR